MQERIYLLDIQMFLEGEDSSMLCAQAMEKLDSVRLEKVKKINNAGARAMSLGAGLLIQKAVAEYKMTAAFFQHYDVIGLLSELECIPKPIQIEYEYLNNGKPRFKDLPICFSISHSGRYVLLTISEREIGADIQEMKSFMERIAKRYFSPEENIKLADCSDEEGKRILFYDLWTKKEALGKLLGDGIFSGIVGKSVNEVAQNVEWISVDAPKGYALNVCRKVEKEI